MEWLLGKDLHELTHIALTLGLHRYTGKQMADWLYKKRVRSIEAFSNLSKTARGLLSAHFEVGGFTPAKVMLSVDGTKKYLFPTLSGSNIETVMIPEENRTTLCLSSQAGCRMGCRFCMTARQGYQAQLIAGEIISQLQNVAECSQLTNIVYMGMGEPMDNFNEVMKSLHILTSEWGWGWSPKRITVSTIGLLPQLKRFLDETNCHLAISLHHPFDTDRQRLIPMQKNHPITEILSLIRQYDFSGQRRVSFEYILFKGINDTPAHATALARLLKGLECRVNLIRYHIIPDSPLYPSSSEAIAIFQKKVTELGVMATIRASRGEDILAACGLLSTHYGAR